MLINYEKSYTDIINIINNNSFYYDYEIDSLSKVLHIIVTRNHSIVYLCQIDTNSSDYDDFFANYANKSGSWNYYERSYQFDTTIEKTNYFQLINTSGGVNDSYLYKGSIFVENGAVGDSVKLQVVDKDNVLGYGVDFVLNEFFNVILSTDRLTITPPANPDGTPAKKKIPSLFYFKLIYTGNSSNIILNMEYEWK